ncbi:hypothetical protein [Chryseobacterium populi]|uniref:Uncharacterized protein n=1 Tax=Chryseobacterium populi TaxID=1144316 RepID=J2K659_9FLAO|nr:hypothetical protein [Chryseobacterium populi]EJL68708.1 hypothetical protein PMI13_03534 [Chryseobacterium populi]
MDTNTSTGQATNPAENAVVFVNNEVLAPPAASPMMGAAKIIIDQSTGMMVQDLQSFLKGFEQLGLIALSRLANNLLTYGTPSMPQTGGGNGNTEAQDTGKGNEMMRDLFKMVSDYAEVKTRISTTMYTTGSDPNEKQNTAPSNNFSDEDPEKKNI